MKPNFYTSILINCFFFLAIQLGAQTPDSIKTVQLSAEIQSDPARITLSWYTIEQAFQYSIYKKEFGDENFGSPVETLGASATTWTDVNVERGKLYHYKLVRSAVGNNGYGYITAGIETNIESDMGVLLMVVDTSVISRENTFLRQYQQDLINEGWRPKIIEVDRDTSVVYVKSKIKEYYDQEAAHTRGLVLIGHVPVPYSGELNPDGHGNHIGAWPADTYYADIDGSWTDIIVNNTSAAKNRNHNVPGDGKFDQSAIPFDNTGEDNYAELETGRIDFANLDAFEESELELLERYFQKNHAYRANQIETVYRGLVENNFASFEEGFGQNGLRDFATMFAKDSVFYIDYDNLKNEPYIWAYACGGGNYYGAGGINNASAMARDSLQAIFTMHFGSYFGDWDNEEGNYLRAALGSGTILTNAWAGRPNWPHYFMAMGKNIGYSVKMAMNNPNNIHDSGFGNRWVHIALMGDPSLRMYVTEKARNLKMEEVQYGINLKWSPPTQQVEGYHLYARTDVQSPYQQVNNELITDTFYFHKCLTTGRTQHYLLRAVELKKTASGSFFNLSPGSRDSMSFAQSYAVSSQFDHTRYGDTIVFENLSSNANFYEWDFGDGETSNEEHPVHVYTESGDYEVRLIARNDCVSDTASIQIEIILTSVDPAISGAKIGIYPNPTNDFIFVEGSGKNLNYHIWNCAGVKVLSGKIPGDQSRIDVRKLPYGLYYSQFENAENEVVLEQKFIKIN